MTSQLWDLRQAPEHVCSCVSLALKGKLNYKPSYGYCQGQTERSETLWAQKLQLLLLLFLWSYLYVISTSLPSAPSTLLSISLSPSSPQQVHPPPPSLSNSITPRCSPVSKEAFQPISCHTPFGPLAKPTDPFAEECISMPKKWHTGLWMNQFCWVVVTKNVFL